MLDFFAILIKHRQMKMISDGQKITQKSYIKKQFLN